MTLTNFIFYVMLWEHFVTLFSWHLVVNIDVLQFMNECLFCFHTTPNVDIKLNQINGYKTYSLVRVELSSMQLTENDYWYTAQQATWTRNDVRLRFFQRIITCFQISRILRLGKMSYFNVFYNSVIYTRNTYGTTVAQILILWPPSLR